MSTESEQVEIERVQAKVREMQAHQLEVVRGIGEAIGYGNLMDLAARAWREKHPGSEFMLGPCASGVEPCVCRDRRVASSGCDWCAGAGWLTKAVKKQITTAVQRAPHSEDAEETCVSDCQGCTDPVGAILKRKDFLEGECVKCGHALQKIRLEVNAIVEDERLG